METIPSKLLPDESGNVFLLFTCGFFHAIGSLKQRFFLFGCYKPWVIRALIHRLTVQLIGVSGSWPYLTYSWRKGMENKIEITQNKPSAEALFRYLVVSMILAREQQGETRPVAIDAIAAEGHPVTDGRTRKVSSRTLYRWMNAFERCGFKGLLPSVREPKTESLVIPLALLDFFKQQKELDPKTSIPELIRRAKELHLIDDTTEVDRTTVWRWLKRMGANTTRSATHRTYRDKRRFAYPHRMDMVLCDGKHFRAGASRLRRVAIFFLDDATRLGLQVVVGTSETAELFLRGLFESISRYGAMSALYVDNGSGFTAHDSIAVLQQLNVLFIRGEAGYPEGRGKIERFNQTALTHCLRNLDSNPGVNPSCSSVELRLRHFLFHQYNHTPHEGLDRQTPWTGFIKIRVHYALEKTSRN